MAIAFVVSPTDFDRLKIRFLDQLKCVPIVCQSQTDIDTLSRVHEIYFVASRLSMGSTAYQQLVIDAFSASEHSTKWLLRLEDVAIPLGFDVLKNLPEGKPQRRGANIKR
jgi:hypothetical protein